MKSERISKFHLPALDGVRGLAVVLVVLLAHYTQILDGGVPIERRVSTLSSFVGGTGVDLFFVLSGFLITGILLDTRESPTYFRAFYARRFLRIFPLYYAYLFIQFFPVRGMHRLLEKVDPFASVNPLWYVAYLSNLSPNQGTDFLLSHMWSLAIEEQFYLVWPLILFLLPRRFLVPTCLAGIVAATSTRFAMAFGGVGLEILHRFTLGRMDTLLLGALAAGAFRDEGRKAIWSRWLRPVAAVSGLTFAAVVGYHFVFKPAFSFYFTIGSGAVAVFYACLVFWSATAGSRDPILCLRPLRVLGKYSYGLYVLHALPFHYLSEGMSRATLGDRLLIIAASAATTGVLTYISWVALESPALSFKRYFDYEPARPRVFEADLGSPAGPEEMASRPLAR